MSSTMEAPARSVTAPPIVSGWKSVLTHVEPGPEGHARLDAAIHLVERCGAGARLIGLGAQAPDPMPVGDPYGVCSAQVLTVLRQEVQSNLEHAEESFRARVKGLSSEWRVVEDRPGAALARAARAADVIVTGGVPVGRSAPGRAEDVGELALSGGRPVLIAPPAGGMLVGRSVMVAWKDTREARRAVADAMPLLQAAGEVAVVAVSSDKAAHEETTRSAMDVAAWLELHGVNARPHVRSAPEDRTAAVLEDEVATRGADLIVAGCYGHGRLREWLFGGVTRDLLYYPPCFVLMSH